MISLQEYFKEYQHSFWNWREQTEVITLTDGSTLVYKVYLMKVLEALSLADTPPIDAVLMALAATKPQAKEAVQTIEQDVLMLLYGGTEEQLESPKGFDFLYLLQQLPKDYHQDKERLFLLQTIFTNCYKPFDKANMQQILEESKSMSNSSFEQLVAEDGTPINPNRLFRALHVLQLLAEQFPTLESLLEALKTAQDLEAPILETPPSNPDWREQLVEELPTFYMASLLPALQAGLALPSLQRLQQQEAFGGTADLSNKGELDRLLISEFAYDKTLFLSRLVNKEALYRQREASPERPTLTRHILIDISIYNWGTIKQIAYGIALALEKAEEEHIHSHIYALGKQAKLLNWNGVEMVAQELGQVAPILNAAEGLQAFFKKNKQTTQQELILISSQEAVQQPAMQQVIQQHPTRLHYWIAPTKEGKIRVYQYHSGKKLIQEFLLFLKEIWHADHLPKSKKGSTDPRLLAKETPILVPEPRHYEQLLWATSSKGKEELFMLAAHGHVLRHYGEKSVQYQSQVQGWEWLYGGLVDYTLVEAGLHSSGDFMLLVGMRSPSCLDLVNMSTQTQTSIQLPNKKKWYLQHLVYEQDAFYAIDNNKEAWIVEVQEKPVLEPFADVEWVEQALKKHQLFLSHKKSLGRPERHYQILKNINSISITEHGHLLLNGRHQLQLNAKNIIKIEPRTSPTIISARQDYKKKRQRHFTFPDGSTVMANSLGLMTLTSSNANLPPIYLPMVLNKSLGMATQEHFCGNPYYYKNGKGEKSSLVTPHFFFTMYVKPFVDTILGSVTV